MNQFYIDGYNKMRFEMEIDLMKQAIDSYERNMPSHYKFLIFDCERRIFNAAVAVGDFTTAREYVKTNEDATLMVRLAKAFAREEQDTCRCSCDVMPGNIELPLFFKWSRIYNQDTGVWVDVYKCSKCNFMTTHPNATCTQSARNLERVRANPINANPKTKMKDHEALR